MVSVGWPFKLTSELLRLVAITEKSQRIIGATATVRAIRRSMKQYDWSTVGMLAIELLAALENVEAHHIGGDNERNDLGRHL